MVTYYKYYKPLKTYIPMIKVEFLALCRAIGITGNKEQSTYEALQIAASEGNENAKELINNIKRID